MLLRRLACAALLSSIAACGGNALKPSDGGDAAAEAARPLVAPSMHRAVAVACPTDRSAATCMHLALGGVPLNGGDCTNDGDCVSGPNGRCDPSSPNDGACDRCSYDECFADTDCAGRGLCDCRAGPYTGANVCTSGNCRVDADCGVGGYCSPSASRCPGYPDPASIGYFCRTSKDTCVEDADCTSTTQSRQCRFDAAAGHWRCIDFPACPV